MTINTWDDMLINHILVNVILINAILIRHSCTCEDRNEIRKQIKNIKVE